MEFNSHGVEKPELERVEIIGVYGEIVSQLTPESEQLWSEYLRKVGEAARKAAQVEIPD